MRILLWHGYLLGGTGSNVYTRTLAREWSACRPRRHRRLPGAAAGALRPRRRARRRPDCRRPAAGLRARPLRGLRARLVQDCTRPSSTHRSRRTPPPSRELLPADLVFANHVLLGGPVGAATGAPFARQGARLGARVLDARQRPSWRRGGARRSRARAATFVGSEHIRARARGGRRPRRPRARGAARGRRRRVRPRPRDEALAELSPRRARDPPNPGNARRAPPRRGNADRLAAFLAERRPTVVYFGKLIENKGVHLLLEALRGLDARAVIVGFGDYRAELERRAARAHALHRPARAPPPRPPARARRRDRRAVDLPGGVRDGRGRGRRRRLAAARRAPLRPRRGRGRARGRVPAARSGTSRRSRRGRRRSAREAGPLSR